ncbi:MAG: Fur-regulated basic protein FbpA [Bacillus sp. (in: Bacteria)]|nr:Fur-regulated basic protein FbpA [Heyndrickxia ginsengihumi]MBE6183351.1 Fur-regulated basic protein FbpA [Bacillus sp. (in: firmicutes)]
MQGGYLVSELENVKKNFIDKLLENGIYKLKNKQLYELTIQDLEKMYDEVKDKRTS